MKHRQQEGTERNKGTVHRTKKGRVQQTPEERTTDRDLGAPSPATVPTIPYQSGDTGGEILGKEHKGRQTSKGARNKGALPGAKLSARGFLATEAASSMLPFAVPHLPQTDQHYPSSQPQD